MYYSDGSVYEGEWYNDQRSGKGLLKLSNNNRYEGSWEYDMKNGPGKYFDLNKGQVYTGSWKDDVAKCGILEKLNTEEDPPNPPVYPIPPVSPPLPWPAGHALLYIPLSEALLTTPIHGVSGSYGAGWLVKLTNTPMVCIPKFSLLYSAHYRTQRKLCRRLGKQSITNI